MSEITQLETELFDKCVMIIEDDTLTNKIHELEDTVYQYNVEIKNVLAKLTMKINSYKKIT
jgi:predicted ABC-type ATPase